MLFVFVCVMRALLEFTCLDRVGYACEEVCDFLVCWAGVLVVCGVVFCGLGCVRVVVVIVLCVCLIV